VPEPAARVDRSFAALGDPVRRAILRHLAEGEQPVGEVVEALAAVRPISQPAVSQHLTVLREAGLVTVRSEGNRRLYALDPAGIAAVSAWLDALMEPKATFAQPLDALATEIARGRHARRRSTTPADDTGNRAETAGREPA
jgi:DNA-binding transcriptional ArsR family regulator